MIELIYTSVATSSFSDDELRALLARSRANNSMRGLTGVLLHDRGSFLQALEGPRAEVLRIFERTRLDPRHGRVAKLHETNISTRSFGDWTMGFARIPSTVLPPGRTPGHLPGVNDFLRGGSIEGLTRGDPDARARTVLQAFRDGRFRTQLDAPAPRTPRTRTT